MAEQLFPDSVESPITPPAKRCGLRILLWAIVGAVLGALWALYNYGTEGRLESIVTTTLTFGLGGALVSMLVAKGCRT